ncbi:MAG: hypothetical protein MI924_11510 [Chloroflexales bacterium]|nr:hypothetical protein [Chloroflexales bacterium]
MIASTTFIPGEATSLTAGGNQVDIPANFLDNPATFELLEGSADFFVAQAAARKIVTAFAFRVTDTTTGQRIAPFNKPVQWRFTAPQITAESAVFDTSPANPPAVTPNGVSPGVVEGQNHQSPLCDGWCRLAGPQPSNS